MKNRWTFFLALILTVCFAALYCGTVAAGTPDGSDQQNELKSACLVAAITGINLEIQRYDGWIALRKTKQVDDKDLPALEASLNSLKADLAKYQSMAPADFQLSEKQVSKAWLDGKAAVNVVLNIPEMTRSGPWYHLAGMVGGDYDAMKPKTNYTVTFYEVYPRNYGFMHSAYIYIAGIRAENAKTEVPAPSGWDIKGKLTEGDINKFCSFTSNTKVIQYWQITYGGSYKPTFAIVRSQESLDTVWSKLGIAPEKPEVNFAEAVLVIIQPGRSITQYNYNVDINENLGTINFTLTEYDTGNDSIGLVRQEAILVFSLPSTPKTINVKINRAPGSAGPYPK